MDHLIFVKLACIPNFSFLSELEVTCPGGVGGVGGWLDTDNKTISVQLNLTGTATGTELGKRILIFILLCSIKLIFYDFVVSIRNYSEYFKTQWIAEKKVKKVIMTSLARSCLGQIM